jgi:hypothetical protein
VTGPVVVVGGVELCTACVDIAQEEFDGVALAVLDLMDDGDLAPVLEMAGRWWRAT